MARSTPNINIDTTQKLRDRLGFKQFVLQVNTDTFIYNYIPSTIELNENGRLFTLTLINKKFIFDILELDDVSDYVDVYLFGVKQPQDKYLSRVRMLKLYKKLALHKKLAKVYMYILLQIIHRKFYRSHFTIFEKKQFFKLHFSYKNNHFSVSH